MSLQLLGKIATNKFAVIVFSITLTYGVITAPAIAAGIMQHDIRHKSAKFIEAAPIAASQGRTAIIAYGGSVDVLRAVFQAAGEIAHELGQEINFLIAPENDEDISSTDFVIYTDGKPKLKFTANANDTNIASHKLTLRHWLK